MDRYATPAKRDKMDRTAIDGRDGEIRIRRIAKRQTEPD